MQILDANQAMAEGEALDLLHGSALAGDQRIYAGDYARAADSDLFLITAGLRRKPDESRLDLINRNVALFVQILDSIKSAGLRARTRTSSWCRIRSTFSRNWPCNGSGFPGSRSMAWARCWTPRGFSSLIAEELKLAPTQVNALILGEHGDSMVPIWSSATVNGLPLAGLPRVHARLSERHLRTHQGSGAEVIKKKGGAGWAVGMAIRDVIHAVLLNKKACFRSRRWRRAPMGCATSA